eukprot:CAMPEP_0119023368 /NCGR_PEP_ID=MMETSP1176-20130426/29822_1 /TAXON_ID=265551 /ORGANISM="Synedropsis recta cf, Strain CCMP1620" /LENGTH=704 /DNA_ID=CAMNT_0006978441 /DNA_START=80 /DNA_END=2194 /DNA_ORIENTATION=+
MPLEIENEDAPLVANGGSKQPPTKNSQFRSWIGLLMLLAVLGLCVFVKKAEPQVNDASVDKERRIPLAQCAGFCKARSNQLQKHHGGDLLDRTYLVTAVDTARTNLHSMLKTDYGAEAFTAMFVDPKTQKVIGDRICMSADRETDVSILRLRRKLQMKALQMQISLLDQRVNLEGCDCTTTSGRRNRRLQEPAAAAEETAAPQPPAAHQLVLPEVPSHYEQFIWGTMGHSAAAAHGNLYNESYTSYLDRGVKDVFGAVGIGFEGRNYAMGGMDSAPQLALCQEAVVGTDVDMISHDFGMTDGQAHWKSALFASRVGMHVNRPAHMSINVAGRHYKARTDALRAGAEDVGIATLHLVPEVEQMVDKGIPDCFGIPQAEIDKHGPFAANFKCKGAIEKEEPCQEKKYNDKICSNRKFKASWHPGWRQHAKQGNMLALFMTETLLEAMKDLVSSAEQDPRALYAKLKAEEDADYETFHASTVPDVSIDFVSDELVAAGVKSHFLHRNKVVCKTALLPAKSRYLGILTESDKVGDFHGFDEGIDAEYATKQPPIEEKDKGSMALVFENKARQQQCQVDLNVDYKDYFYATQDWGWASLKFPNEAEIRAYAPDGFNPVGFVMLCFYKCDWGKCPAGEIDVANGIAEGKWKAELNGEAVEEISRMDQCYGVKTKNGYLNKPNEDGRYELRIWIDKGDKTNFVRLTSIIVL